MKEKIYLFLAMMIMAGNSWGQTCTTPTCAHPASTISDFEPAVPCVQSATGGCATAIGDSVTASGTASLALGSKLTAGSAANTIVMGLGLVGNRLINNITKSLMVGFDSDVPTFYVGPGSGSSGSFGNVGIATSVPGYRLDVNEGDINAITSTKGYRIAGNYVLYHDGTTSDIFVGVDAGNATMSGHNNTAVGNLAGNAMTTGDFNTSIGRQALKLNTTGYWNTACGAGTLLQNTTGHSNTAAGLNALTANTSGTHNTAVGVNALDANTSGSQNTAVGFNALNANITGAYNTAVGMDALFNATDSTNTAVGFQAGLTITTGDKNTFWGYTADASSGTLTNATAIGNGAVANASDDIRLGNTSIQTLRCNQTVITTSDRRIKNNIKENVPGLSFINLLKPVTYHLDIHKQNAMEGYRMKRDSAGNPTNEIDTLFWSSKYDIEKVQYTGFIAQQVDSAAQQIGYDFSGVYKPKNATKDVYGLKYSDFVVPLIKAVQELSKKTDSLQSAVDSLTIKKSQRKAGQNNNEQEEGSVEATLQIELANQGNIILYQNEPNPFNGFTVIRYFLSENLAGNIFIVFYDMYGKEINKLEIKERGFGKIEANTQNLSNGVYSYSIKVHDKIIETKKMIRNK